MDKVTIRFKRHHEQFVPENNLSDKAEIDYIEQLIRSSDSEKPQTSVNVEQLVTPKSKFHVISMVASAMIIGLLFGLSVFAFFIDSPVPQQVISMQIPNKSYTVVQAGVFSKLSTATTVQKQLQTLGFQPAIETISANRHRILLAISMNRAEAMNMLPMFLQKQVTSYVSSIPLSTKTIKQDTAFFSYCADFNEKMISTINEQLAEPNKREITAKWRKQMSQIHEKWADEAHQIQPELGKQANLAIVEMSIAQQKGIEYLNTYAGTGSTSALWAAQSQLIEAVLAEQRLRQFY